MAFLIWVSPRRQTSSRTSHRRRRRPWVSRGADPPIRGGGRGSRGVRILRSAAGIVGLEGCGSSDPRRGSRSERIETIAVAEAESRREETVGARAVDASRSATALVFVVSNTILEADQRIRTPGGRVTDEEDGRGSRGVRILRSAAGIVGLEGCGSSDPRRGSWVSRGADPLIRGGDRGSRGVRIL